MSKVCLVNGLPSSSSFGCTFSQNLGSSSSLTHIKMGSIANEWCCIHLNYRSWNHNKTLAIVGRLCMCVLPAYLCPIRAQYRIDRNGFTTDGWQHCGRPNSEQVFHFEYNDRVYIQCMCNTCVVSMSMCMCMCRAYTTTTHIHLYTSSSSSLPAVVIDVVAYDRSRSLPCTTSYACIARSRLVNHLPLPNKKITENH